MRSAAALVVLGSVLTGCAVRAGGQTSLMPGYPSDVVVEARVAHDLGGRSIGVTSRARRGSGRFDLGLGVEACARRDLILAFLQACGRVFPLDLGRRARRFDFGLFSPAAGPGLLIPLRQESSSQLGTPMSMEVYALEIQVWGGLDVRPLQDRVAQPYLSVSLGFVYLDF